MLAEILIIFIIATIIFFILSVFLMDEYPWLSLGFISMGLIFSALSTWGMWKIELTYTSYNSTWGNTSFEVYSLDYGEPYSYVFFFVFLAFCGLIVKAGFNVVKQAKEKEKEQGELDIHE
jgi:hypothetical protein